MPLHEHSLPRVVLALSEVDFDVTSADGKVNKLRSKPGDTIFGTGVRHREVNVSDKPAELLLVEFKGQ